MKNARMNISHFRFILFNLKIFGEIVTTIKVTPNFNQNENLIVSFKKKTMKKAPMNISHLRFILFNLKIFGEIVNAFKRREDEPKTVELFDLKDDKYCVQGTVCGLLLLNPSFGVMSLLKRC